MAKHRMQPVWGNGFQYDLTEQFVVCVGGLGVGGGVPVHPDSEEVDLLAIAFLI